MKRSGPIGNTGTAYRLIGFWTKLDILKKIWYNKKKCLFYRPAPDFPGKYIAYGRSLSLEKKSIWVGPIGELGLARPRPALSTGSVAICVCSGIPGRRIAGKQMFGSFIIYLQKIFLKHLTLRKFGLIRPLSARRILGKCKR